MARPEDGPLQRSRRHRSRVLGVALTVAGFALAIVGVVLYDQCTATFSVSDVCVQWGYRVDGFGMFGLGIALFVFGTVMLYRGWSQGGPA